MRYYRPLVSDDLLQLIGVFAGFRGARLEFTITPKRKFLGRILIRSDHRKTRLLRTGYWKALKIAGPEEIRRISEYVAMKTLFSWGAPYPHLVADCMVKIDKILSEVHDFALVYN